MTIYVNVANLVINLVANLVVNLVVGLSYVVTFCVYVVGCCRLLARVVPCREMCKVGNSRHRTAIAPPDVTGTPNGRS